MTKKNKNNASRPKFRFSIPTQYLVTWFVFDALYITAIFTLFSAFTPPVKDFLIFHLTGIILGTMVMFTGLGAGVIWIPMLTFFNIPPAESVSISIFTQIAGKGIGSYNYIRAKMVDLKVARHFLPYAFAGVFIGYFSGYAISVKFERLLLIIFVIVASYLLFKMLQSLQWEKNLAEKTNKKALEKSRFIVVFSSFFTGLLSIGNCDWLIPYMELQLKMPTSRAVATGLFVMFYSALFFLFLTFASVFIGLRGWPESSPILFATCSGVIIGGQIGTRLIRFEWLRARQKHAFICMLAFSILHLLW